MSQTQPSDVWNWRQYFTNPSVLKNGEHDARNGIVTDFKTLPDMSGASCKIVRGFNVEVRNVPRTPEELENYPGWNRFPIQNVNSLGKTTIPVIVLVGWLELPADMWPACCFTGNLFMDFSL